MMQLSDGELDTPAPLKRTFSFFGLEDQRRVGEMKRDEIIDAVTTHPDQIWAIFYELLRQERQSVLYDVLSSSMLSDEGLIVTLAELIEEEAMRLFSSWSVIPTEYAGRVVETIRINYKACHGIPLSCILPNAAEDVIYDIAENLLYEPIAVMNSLPDRLN